VSAAHAAPAAFACILLGLGVGMTLIGRGWPAPSGERRARRQVSDASLLDDLLGPPSAYTDYPHAPGVIRQGFHDCPNCDQTTAGVLTRDGWTCGQCLTPTAAGGTL
jgi:hypothetical protein